MNKIVIIGANSFQNQLIVKAKELGFETHVFAWKAGDIGEYTADYFYPISIVEKDKILNVCKTIRPVAVVTIGSDLASLTANYVARALNLSANSEHCDLIATNKFMMREALQAGGIWTPMHKKIKDVSDLETLNEIKFPVIVKPTDRSGSRAITKVDEEKELKNAVLQAMEQSFEHAAIVEEFIEGKEYSCECISYHGQHHFLAFTKKYTTGAPNFIETGHMQPADIEKEKYDEIINVIFKALNALEIREGASHTEFKITSKGEVKIIEIGARMGGDCIGSDLVPLSTGEDFVKMVIDVACGRAPIFAEKENRNKAFIKFIFSDRDIEELELRKKEKPETIFRVSDIEKDKSEKDIHDSSSRRGYYIYTEEK